MISRLLLRLVISYGLDHRYWQLRKAQKWLFFHIGNWGFKGRQSIENASLAIRIFVSLFWVVLSSLVVTAIVFGLLLITNYLGEIDQNNRPSYDGALLAIASVIGVFLSLYFTSINTVIGTIYAKLPSRIRDLLIQERVGNVSVGFLVFLTLLCISLLAAGIVADIRPRTAIVTISILGCFSILIFAQLSKRVFLFFDPTIFANQLLGELYRWSEQATARGYRWHDPSFQNHYRERARDALHGLSALVEIAHEENYLKREPLANLLARISAFCRAYIKHKESIPTTSRWYALIPKHKDWYLATDSLVTIATQTQTSLQPEWKPDPNWLEHELLDLEIQAISKCLADGRKETGFQVIDLMNSVFETLGQAWALDFGQRLLGKTESATQVFLEQSHNDETDAKAQQGSHEALGVADYTGLYPISLLFGVCKSAEITNIAELEKRIAKLNWRDGRQIYSLGLPTQILERLEFIQQRLDFEMRAEGRLVSPTWYMMQLACQSIAFQLQNQMQTLQKIGLDHYVAKAHELTGQDKNLQAAVIISRGLEFYSKFLTHLPSFEGLATALDKRHTLEGLKWPEWDWPVIRDSLIQSQNSLLVDLAKCIPGLSRIERGDDLPDYFGRAVHISGEQCFQALLNDDVRLFQSIFPRYFTGVFNISEQLKAKTSEWQVKSAVATFSDPFIDLIDLSGYARIFSELHSEPRLWQICKQVWDTYLGRTER